MAFLRQMPMFRPFWPERDRRPIEPAIAARDPVVETDSDAQPQALADRVRDAFRTIPPNPTEMRVIRALLDNPGATGLELSRACGWVGTTWQVYFTTMCRRRSAAIWPGGRPQGETGAEIAAIADYEAETSQFSLKPEFLSYFKALAA